MGPEICGCEGTLEAAATREGRPGLRAIAFRIGDHGAFLTRMRARLPGQEVPPGDEAGARPLDVLTGGPGSGDATDAVLDAAATALDVLTFYAERIANEGFLRTATERRSLLELGRAIGYELRPGIAASTYVAFTVEDAVGAPGVATVPAGTPVQSVPGGPGEVPQTFETSVAVQARAEWNALRPLRLREQPLSTGAETMFLAGTALRIAKGDVLLIAAPGATQNDPPQTRIVEVRVVTDEPELDRTRVDVANPSPGPPPSPPPVTYTFAPVRLEATLLNQANVGQFVVGQAWRESDLSTFIGVQRWEPQKVTAHVQHQVSQTQRPAVPLPEAETGVFAFRERLGIFGAAAPRWNTLPAAQRFGEWVDEASGDPPARVANFKPAAYPRNWDQHRPRVTHDSQNNAYSANADVLHLERGIPSLRPNAWMVLAAGGADPKPFRIQSVSERALSDFGLTAKTAAVQVADPTALGGFTMRETTAHVESDPLALAPLPIDEPLLAGVTTIELEQLVLGLEAGRPLILTGERADLPGVIESEVLYVKEAIHAAGRTLLTFTTGLVGSYIRASVTLNANVVHATHGETVMEVLGSGDGARPNQVFTLHRPPLTYVGADTPSGTKTTLAVRVDGVLWEEVAHLYGSPPAVRRYVVRREDDGTPHVIGGDGVQGARVPTGLENVSAVYRSGIGLAGQVAADRLTLLPRRPLGVRAVTNPLAAGGAADSESRDDARANAPLTVRTIDRVVSLRDYEDFARGFAGIGKAQAVALRKGALRLVHLPVAGADGDVPDASVMGNLVAALRRFGDPGQRFVVDTFDPRFFRVVARLRLDTPRLEATEILAAARRKLLDAFAFARRSFGQPVTGAEIMAILHSVPGVISVDIDALNVIAQGTDPAAVEAVLPAASARWRDPRPERDDNTILRAELLLISPVGAGLTERTGSA